MEVKKSHKADLEHLRPWMFLGAFVIMALLFILVLEVHIGGRSDDFDDFDDIDDLDDFGDEENEDDKKEETEEE